MSERTWQILGWLLFMVSAAAFIGAGLRQDDPWTLAGALVFLVACGVFLVPLLLRR